MATGVPASYGRRRLWFLNQLDTTSSLYNIHLHLRVTGPLDSALLRRSVDELVRRHETLRTRVVLRDGDVLQVVDPPAPAAWTGVDLSDETGPVRDEQARKTVAAHAAHGFDLAEDAPLRGLHVRLSETEHRVLLTMHHAMVDNRSVRSLESELIALLTGGSPGREAEPGASYADYARHQRRMRGSERWNRRRDFWRAKLEGAPERLALPEHAGWTPGSHAGGHVPFTVPEPTVAALRSLAETGGANLFTVLLAGYAALLSERADTSDVLVGIAVAARPGPEWGKYHRLFRQYGHRPDQC
ncbi:hypothetical protein GCM10023191_020600 [Actinoallomurus oryzae]|uniref:Condensation domain-containing protein n=1 Tax=Actinoallomurus oryzae TaxID=502180 RepID=A0ABP8PP87_9ACTN